MVSYLLYIIAPPHPASWGIWSSLTSCSTSCGYGTQKRMRVCNKPSSFVNIVHPKVEHTHCPLTDGSGNLRKTENETLRCNTQQKCLGKTFVIRKT